MDTRTKIVDSDAALRLAAEGATVVSGYFDPLIAEHADRLRGLKQSGQPLLVAVAPPEDQILPARARAELVASLACVDHVTEWFAELPVHVSLLGEDAAGRQQLVSHVHRRQQAAS